jgi:hypothetical protein
MSTHNRYIYHCLKCGSISVKEVWEECPHCCGSPMNQSAVETVEDPPQTPRPAAHTSAEHQRVVSAQPPDLSVWFD